MRTSGAVLLGMFGWMTSACVGLEDDAATVESPGAGKADDVEGEPGAETDSVTLDLGGADLRCVSSLVQDDRLGPHPGYLRLDLRRSHSTDFGDIFDGGLAAVVPPSGTGIGAPPAEQIARRWAIAPLFGFVGTGGATVNALGDVLANLTARPAALRGVLEGELSIELFADASQPGATQTFDVVCWEPEITPAFRYDGAGACVDAAGDPGRTPLPFAFVRGSGYGECGVIAGDLHEGLPYYHIWQGLNLAGADLSGAALEVTHLLDVELAGADLAGLDTGYAVLTGSIDEHTRLGDATADCADAVAGTLYCVN